MNVLDSASRKFFTARTLVERGVFRPTRPDRLVRTGLALHRWGPTAAAGYQTSAIRYPDALALIDDLGPLTFADGPPPHQRAWPTRSPTAGSARATTSRSCAATTAA